MPITGPGLLALWAYLEELGIPPCLHAMGLDVSVDNRGYNWLDFLLLDVARRFYGLPTASRACQQEEPTLALFCHLVKLPCNDSLLNGLAQTTESQAAQLRQWLIQRMVDLQLICGPRLGMDFHHIDLDMELDRLREFGKGPSPKKKICHSGFRPHIAWDLDSGTLVVAEFRKGSVGCRSDCTIGGRGQPCRICKRATRSDGVSVVLDRCQLQDPIRRRRHTFDQVVCPRDKLTIGDQSGLDESSQAMSELLCWPINLFAWFHHVFSQRQG